MLLFTSIYKTKIKQCNFQYSNFSNSSLKETKFEETNLVNTCLGECKLKSVTFNDCDLFKAQMFKTKLKDIDFRTCNIEGIVVEKEDLNGMIVNEFQAIELSKLLGIIVK